MYIQYEINLSHITNVDLSLAVIELAPVYGVWTQCNAHVLILIYFAYLVSSGIVNVATV